MTMLPPYGGVPFGRPGFPMQGYPGAGAIGGVVDADPLTPGIQAQPGVLTATGPSQVVGGAFGTGMLSSGLRQPGFIPGNVGFGGFSGGVVDADPLTPGIQSQPGVVTAVGPPRVIQAGTGMGGFQGLNTAVVDADPLTPGIQAQPGVLTATGPSQVVGGGFGGVQQFGYQQGFQTGFQQVGAIGGVVDADPLTPGIQAQPGTITATGPTRVVSGGYPGFQQPGAFGGLWNCCPWWVWPLLCFLLLAGLIAGIWAAFRTRRHRRRAAYDDEDEEEDRKVRFECTGYENANGECVQCPEGFKWNGKKCTAPVVVATETTEKTTTTPAADDKDEKTETTEKTESAAVGTPATGEAAATSTTETTTETKKDGDADAAPEGDAKTTETTETSKTETKTESEAAHKHLMRRYF